MPPTILAVGKSAAGTFTGRRALRRAGYRVIEAGSDVDALRLAAEASPAAILVVSTPHGEIATLCQQLRAGQRTAGIPVIHVSSPHTYRSTNVMECAADVCLDAPVGSQTLVGVLKSVVHAVAASSADEEVPSGIPETVASSKPQRATRRRLRAADLVALDAGWRTLCLQPAVELSSGAGSARRLPFGVSSAAPMSEATPNADAQDLRYAACILSAVLANRTNVMIISDIAGRVVMSSKGTGDFFGSVASEFGGMNIAVLDSLVAYSGDDHTDRPGSLSRLTELACSGHATHAEELFLQRHGSPGCWVLCDAMPLRCEDGRTSGSVLTIRDVTAQKLAQGHQEDSRRELEQKTKTLATANERLARSNRQLQQFASAVSHDVKSPLGTISTLTTWLCEEYGDMLDSEARSYLNCLQKAVYRLNALINGMLEYSRLGFGERKPAARVDCSEILASVMAGLRGSVESNGAIITHDPLPVVVMNVRDLEQVLQNLLSNSIAYAGDAVPPKIHVSAVSTETDWILSVTDNGTGIERQYFETIFEPLQRLHNCDSGGVGLGLSICRRIVESYGGRIWLESTVGQGTTFYFSIPTAVEESQPSLQPVFN